MSVELTMLARVAICAISAGWIVPLFASAALLLRHVELLGTGALAQNSFPHLSASTQLFTVSMIWLAVVVIGWAWKLSA